AESKPAVADGLYYVQAGIFGNKDNAAALAAKIRNAGFEASVKNVEGGDKKTLYRVVAGSPSSHKKAVEMSESLNRKGIKTIVHRQ
ncbi:MAG TPA: SPOR domain-containing protein, partial [Thermodesulfovibrionales bacterium]|nr:SPOR domain-containing protein [Thermodesulfovibrionales bacterium]